MINFSWISAESQSLQFPEAALRNSTILKIQDELVVPTLHSYFFIFNLNLKKQIKKANILAILSYLKKTRVHNFIMKYIARLPLKLKKYIVINPIQKKNNTFCSASTHFYTTYKKMKRKVTEIFYKIKTALKTKTGALFLKKRQGPKQEYALLFKQLLLKAATTVKAAGFFLIKCIKSSKLRLNRLFPELKPARITKKINAWLIIKPKRTYKLVKKLRRKPWVNPTR